MHDPRLHQLSGQVELEIKRLDDRRKETGWSPWALIAALAAIGWQLSEQVARLHDWNSVALYGALFVLIADLLRQIVRTLNKGACLRRPGLRFYPAHLHSGTRAFLFFLGLKMAAAAIVICNQAPLTGAFRVAWTCLFGCYVIGVVVIALGTWMDIPMPVGTPEKPKPLAIALVAVFGGLHLFMVVHVAFSLVPDFMEKYQAADVQVALLIFGLVEMAGLLLTFHAVEPMRLRLVHLQRRLALDEIGYDDGKTQIVEAIHGANINVLFKDRLKELHEGFDKLDQNLTQYALSVKAPADTVHPWDHREQERKARLLAKTARDDAENCEFLLVQLWARTCDPNIRRAEGGRVILAEYARRKEQLAAYKIQLKSLATFMDELAKAPVDIPLVHSSWRWRRQPSLRF